MIVIAKKRRQKDLPTELQHYAFSQDKQHNLPLTIDKKYVVAGIRETLNNKFYLIIPDDGELKGYPWWFPSSLFKVVDKSMPPDWKKGGVEGDVLLTFPELALDKTGLFESNLEDGEDREVSVFLKYYETYARSHGLWYVDGKLVEDREE